MRSVTVRLLCAAAVSMAAAIAGNAQQRPAAANDPRIGLKAGLKNAGEAAKNMEHIANLPRPEGFFDPEAPAGTPTPPERESGTLGRPNATDPAVAPPPEGAAPAPA